ncbi:unnamed protein product, partial [marine sediment metagenome]
MIILLPSSKILIYNPKKLKSSSNLGISGVSL